MIVKDGNPREVFDFYNALIAEKEISTVQIRNLGDGSAQTSSGTGDAKVEEIFLCDSKGKIVDCLDVGEAVDLRIKVKVYCDIESLVLGYSVKDRLGQEMYGSNTWHSIKFCKISLRAVYFGSISHFSELGCGSYSITTALHDQESHLY